MNEELNEVFEEMEDEYLAHYGTKRHSGRYPWGSGDEPYQHEPGYPDTPPFATAKAWLDDYDKLVKQGIKETEIAKMYDFGSTTNLRAAHRAAVVYARNDERNLALKYMAEGKGLRETTRLLGYKNDSSVRSLLNEQTNINKNRIFQVAAQIKDAVDKYKRVDVGEGAEVDLGISQETLNQALYVLQAEYGYKVKGRRIPQKQNPKQMTTVRAAVPPDAPDNILYTLDLENRIYRMKNYGSDDEKNDQPALKPTFSKPTVLDRKRLGIVYKDEGGADKDGLIEIRPGLQDLSLGSNKYAQVRIAVANDKGEPAYYLKGMAIYSDNLPPGKDIIINTNKPKYVRNDNGDIVKDENGNPVITPDSKALKELKRVKETKEIDWDNPFGSTIKEGGQYWYTDKKTGEEKLGLVNMTRNEGDWIEWSKNLPAQFLAKQDPKFVKNQLKLTIEQKIQEFDEMKKITNPVVKQKMLMDFAGDLDSQAVHLKAAALPRQKYEVLLPVPSLKDNEVFAPNFNDGEKVALIRFPHAGPFEIPILTVNNKNKEALESIGKTSTDAVGINPYNANKLSGADFDGDTVIAIPLSDKVNISSRNSLPGLTGFEPKEAYPPEYKVDAQGNYVYDEDGKPIIVSKVMSKKMLQRKMGEASNLITDMTLMGASDEELAKAVKNSMVIVDAPKHKLNYRKSELDNDIAKLKMKYQAHDLVKWDGSVTRNSTSAATLLSAAKAEKSVPVHEGRQVIDPATGKLVWTREGYKKKTYTDKKTGEVREKIATARSNWMSDTDDAFTLVRDKNNPIEVAYAEYANALKSLANEVRKEKMATGNLKYSPEMAIKYADEVANLNNQYREAQMNKPREREAQTLAEIYYQERLQAIRESGEEFDKEDDRKLRDQLIKKARAICGASRYTIKISDKEWEAIQAGALSHTRVANILDRADPEDYKRRATPRKEFNWTPVCQRLAISMRNSGWSNAEIAERIGASESAVIKFLKERS